MSQKVKILAVTVDAPIYVGELTDPATDTTQHTYTRSGHEVMRWLCDGFRFRFNQLRSRRSKYVHHDGQLALGADGKPVLHPIGTTVNGQTHAQARATHSFLAAMPSLVLEATQKTESTEWFAATRRRKTRLAQGQAPGAMPGFRKRRDNAAFVCWYNGGRNAVFRTTGRRTGIVTITGQNPTIGDIKSRRWKIKIRVRVTQPIRDYTSIVVNWDARTLVFTNPPLPIDREPTGNAVGLDMGVTSRVATSDGTFFVLPDVTKLAKQQKYHQRKMAKSRIVAARQGRNFWESNRYQRHKTKAAQLQAKIARIREDHAHKLSHQLVTKNDYIALEDLSLSNMTRKTKGQGAAAKRGLNRVLQHSGLSQLRTFISYKANLAGVHIAPVPPAYTSQRCNACGVIDPANRKSQAVMACQHCQHTAHADTNAAKNILDRAHNLWGGQSQAWSKDKTTVAQATAAPAMKRKPSTPVII